MSTPTAAARIAQLEALVAILAAEKFSKTTASIDLKWRAHHDECIKMEQKSYLELCKTNYALGLEIRALQAELAAKGPTTQRARLI